MDRIFCHAKFVSVQGVTKLDTLILPEASTPTEAPTVFNHPEFGELRTVEISGEPWFVGKDVAVALGYSDTTQAIRKNISDEDKMTRPGDAPSIIDSFGRTQHPVWINESGLYSLILSSKLPSAKDFKHWVTTNHQKEIS